MVGKRPSRYRYQIYKDVLQHWYYSPLNRLLLKLDVDDFIKRQPTSHFLNKKEENLIHLRRFLLCEHYNTLRWYTQMQHYRSMKTKIGSTKSFSSKAYNQQFQGTFKKIRHLFAITPTNKTDLSLLKFDQPLYNEYLNNSKNLLFENSIMHEELETVLKKQSLQLGSPSLTVQTTPESKAAILSSELGVGPEDLVTQSTKIVRQYLLKAAPIRQNYVKKLLSEKNYLELAQFMYKGQKTRGSQPITNNRLFLSQEKDYLLNNQFLSRTKAKQSNKSGDKALFSSFVSDYAIGSPPLWGKQKNDKRASEKKLDSIQEILWLNLLKKWKKHVTDQEFLRNYLNRRVEKREKRKQKKEKNLTIKLERLNKLMYGSLSTIHFSGEATKRRAALLHPLRKRPKGDGEAGNVAYAVGAVGSETAPGFATGGFAQESSNALELNTFLTNGLEKAINEGAVQGKTEEMFSNLYPAYAVPFSKGKLFPAKLKLEKLQLASQLKTERSIRSSIKTLSTIVKKGYSVSAFLSLPVRGKGGGEATSKIAKKSFLNQTLNKKTWVLNSLKSIQKISVSYKKSLTRFLGIDSIINLLRPDEQKSLKSWRRKERFLNKQKRSRKEFKAFSKKQKVSLQQITPTSKKIFYNLMLFHLLPPLKRLPLRGRLLPLWGWKRLGKRGLVMVAFFLGIKIKIFLVKQLYYLKKTLKKGTKNNQTEVPNRKKTRLSPLGRRRKF